MLWLLRRGVARRGRSRLCSYPIEFLKVQRQLTEAVPGKAAPVRAVTVVDIMRETLRTRGVLGFWRGLSPWLIFSMPRSALRFSVYESAAHLCGGGGQELPPATAAACGTLAGIVEWGVAGTPMQCLSIKMLHDHNRAQPQFRGLADAVRSIVREQGVVGGLFAGLAPTVAKGAINNAIRFATYNELAKVAHSRKRARQQPAELSAIESAAIGGAAGAVSVLVTHPIDVVKTNVQSLSERHGGASMMACARRVWVHEGLQGLYRGIGMRALRVPIENALLFSLFNHFSRLFDAALAR